MHELKQSTVNGDHPVASLGSVNQGILVQSRVVRDALEAATAQTPGSERSISDLRTQLRKLADRIKDAQRQLSRWQ